MKDGRKPRGKEISKLRRKGKEEKGKEREEERLCKNCLLYTGSLHPLLYLLFTRHLAGRQYYSHFMNSEQRKKGSR